MPADSISTVSTNKGTAIQMEPGDHKLTSSYGSSTEAQAYRQEVKDLMDAGKMRDAMAMEVKDVRRAAAEGSGDMTKYNKAMQQMLQKGKEQGYIPKKKQNHEV